jgi:TolA-binding protein
LTRAPTPRSGISPSPRPKKNNDPVIASVREAIFLFGLCLWGKDQIASSLSAPRNDMRIFFLFFSLIFFTPVCLAGETDNSNLDFANGLYARKMYAAAAQEYEKFIQANPASPEISSARFRIAESSYFLKDYEKAVFYFEFFVKDFPGDKRADLALFRVGASKYHLKDFAAAIRVLLSVFKKSADPNIKSGCLFYLGKSYQAREKGDKSLEMFHKAVQDYPQSDYARYASDEIENVHLAKKRSQKEMLETIQKKLAAEDFSGASKDAELFVQKHSESPWTDIAWYKWAVAESGRKNFKKSSELFKKFLENYPKSKLIPESLAGAALSLENEGFFSESASFYEKIMTDFPDHALSKKSVLRLANVYLKMADFEKVYALYQDILFRRVDVEVAPEIVFWVIQYSLDHKRYERVPKALETLSVRFPEKNFSDAINFFLGETSRGLGKDLEAVSHYSKVITEKPDSVYVSHSYLGRGLANARQNQWELAEQDFNEAMRFDQEVRVAAQARFEIANLKLRAGDWTEAAKAFMMVAILYEDPKLTPLALQKAGECFEKAGQTEESKKAFEELKTRYPGWTYEKI